MLFRSQQNGVAERKNRTLMDMAMSMLTEFKSPQDLCADAVSTACHSSNRLYFRKGLRFISHHKNKSKVDKKKGHEQVKNLAKIVCFKCKSETQQAVIDFSTQVQRQHNLPILVIRSDNGSEFKNYTLNGFLGDEGIRHQYSAAYTPQQNGVAERKNRTLLDMARSMLAEFKSPQYLWAEAVSTACHSSNRL